MYRAVEGVDHPASCARFMDPCLRTWERTVSAPSKRDFYKYIRDWIKFTSIFAMALE